MTPRDTETSLKVSRALKEATPTLGDIAGQLSTRKREREGDASTGVSYDAVRSWSIGRSTPTSEHRVLLAQLLDEQADRLRGLARELRGEGE